MTKTEKRHIDEDLDFAIHNKEPQIKCPYCGSTDTAEILYGMPAFTKEFQEKLDSGKIHLGGCCINLTRNEDGTMVQTDPDWYCNSCGKGFTSPEPE